MLRFIVDWIDHVAGRSQAEEIDIQGHDAIAANIPDAGPLPASDFEPLERQLSDTAHPTASQLGIRFQQREFRKLLNAVGHWESVEFYTLNGARIETIEDVPLGPDGGG